MNAQTWNPLQLDLYRTVFPHAFEEPYWFQDKGYTRMDALFDQSHPELLDLYVPSTIFKSMYSSQKNFLAIQKQRRLDFVVQNEGLDETFRSLLFQIESYCNNELRMNTPLSVYIQDPPSVHIQYAKQVEYQWIFHVYFLAELVDFLPQERYGEKPTEFVPLTYHTHLCPFLITMNFKDEYFMLELNENPTFVSIHNIISRFCQQVQDHLQTLYNTPEKFLHFYVHNKQPIVTRSLRELYFED